MHDLPVHTDLPLHTVAIVVALAAAGCLALGTHAQHRAVASGATTLRSFSRSPLWLAGMGLLVLETVLNILALGLAPVALIQPLGALSLVAIVLLGLREGRAQHFTRRVVAGIVLTIASVGLFVGLSAPWSTPPEAAPARVLLLAFLLVSFSVLAGAVAVSALGHLVRILCGGAVFGAVAASAHVLIHDVRAALPGAPDLSHAMSTVHWVLLGAMVAGSLTGMWVIQTAYRSGPPETVLAGLTVIDPLVAVGIGTFLLGEYSHLPIPVLGVLLLTAATAVVGVCLLVRAHPAVEQSVTGPPLRDDDVSPLPDLSPPADLSRPSASSVPESPSVPDSHGATLTNRTS